MCIYAFVENSVEQIKMIRSNLMKKVLEVDVAFTKYLVKLLQNSVFRSLGTHSKLLEFSCNGIVWLAAWLVFTWLSNSKYLQQMQLNMFIGLLLDILVVAFIKAWVRRRRPVPVKDVLVIGPDKFSFPSGHTSRAFLVLMFFTYLNPISMLFWMPLLAWSCSVGLSRLILQRHYFLDVIAGCGIGILEALILKVIWISSGFAQDLFSFLD